MKRQYTVLIVDDDPDEIRILSTMLKENGFKIHVARDGEQAVESVEIHPPDIILMDIQMPKMDGYTACRLIKKKNELLPIIFISAMNVVFNKKIAFDAGGIDYILKPFLLEEVIEYSDNGRGIDKDFDWDNIQSLGLLIVKSLVEGQLKGTMKVENSSSGLSYFVQCQSDIYKSRI